MGRVGTISELWRDPVSSVTGEKIDQAEVSARGMVGDRRFALVEMSTGVVAHPERDKRWQKAIFIKSRTASDGSVEIQVPEHDWLAVDAPNLSGILSAFFEFEVKVRPYERSAVAGETAYAVDRYEVSPIHLITSASVAHLKSLHPAGDPDQRRFRPNIFIEAESDVSGFAELTWIHAAIRLGEVPGTVIAPTKRCGFTIIAQEGLENDPEILRNVMKFGNRNLGVYCAPKRNGVLRIGDAVFMDI